MQKFSMRFSYIYIVGIMLLVSACQIAPPTPILKQAPVYSLGKAAADQSDFTYTTNEWPEQFWWTAFGDSQLDAMIAQALANNPTIIAAEARLKAAYALSDKAYAPFYPTFDFESDITRVHQSKNGIFGILNATDPAYPITYLQRTYSFNFGYEFDFFKKHHHQLLAAFGQANALKAEAYTGRLALSLSIAQKYFLINILKERKKIIWQLIQNQEGIAQFIDARVQKGIESYENFNQSLSAIRSNRQLLLQIQEDISVYSNELQALIAADFDYPICDITINYSLDAFPMPCNLPLDLLAHRADVMANRWRVESAGRQVAAAKAAFYPNINMFGLIGFQAIKSFPLLDQNSVFGLVSGPAIHLPIFEGGLLQADLDQKHQEYHLAVAQYNETVNNSVKEVLNALTHFQKTGERYQISVEDVIHAQKNVELSYLRLQNNLISRVDFINYENDLLNTTDLHIQAFLACLQARLDLIRALGGGYEVSCAAD